MIFKDLDKLLRDRYYPSIKGTVEEQYPNLYKKDYGYAQPAHSLHDNLIWIWLYWHSKKDYKSIQEKLKPVLKRANEIAANLNVYPYFRADFDNFLIQLAVLAAEGDLLKETATAVKEAENDSKKYQMYESWTGIIKHRILGDEGSVNKQHNIFQSHSIVKYYVYPTKKMMEAFVAKDYEALLKVIKQRVEKYWKWHKDALQEEDGEKILNVRKSNPNFFWPWVECTLARLAYIDGYDVNYDSEWLPIQLIKGLTI